MKYLKKTISVILALTMLLSFMTVGVSAADTGLDFELSSTEMAAGSEEWLVVTVKNTNRSPIAGIKFYLYCDTSVFEIRSGVDEWGDPIPGADWSYNGTGENGTIADEIEEESYAGDPTKTDGYSFVFGSSRNNGDPTIAEIYLKVKPGVITGDYSIELDCQKANNAREELLDIDFPATAKTVTVNGISAADVTPVVTFDEHTTNYTYNDPFSAINATVTVASPAAGTAPTVMWYYKVGNAAQWTEGNTSITNSDTAYSFHTEGEDYVWGKTTYLKLVAKYVYMGKTYTAEKETAITFNKANQSEFAFAGGSTATMAYGEQLDLLTTVENNSGVTFSIVSGSDYADIRHETLYTKGVGTVVVKATKAGDAYHNDAEATLTVTITKAKVEIPTAKEGLIYDGGEQTGVYDSYGVYTVTGNIETAAGTYTAIATLNQPDYFEWEDGSFNGEVQWTIAKAKVKAPTAVTGQVYSGSKKLGLQGGGDSTLYAVAGDKEATDAGTYTATVTLKNTDNYEWEDGTTDPKTIQWSIAKAPITASPETLNLTVYNNGAEFALPRLNITTQGHQTCHVVASESSDLIQVLGNSDTAEWADIKVKGNDAKVESGDTPVVITVVLSAPNHNDKTVTVNVTVKNKNDVSSEIDFTAKDGSNKLELTYNGGAQSLKALVNAARCGLGRVKYQLDGKDVDLDEAAVTNVGTYTLSAIFENEYNYGKKDITITVEQAEVAAPTAKDGLVYNGSVLTGVVDSADSALYSAVSGTTATDAGTHTAVYTLNDSANYKWAGDFTGTLQWRIAPKAIKINEWSWSSIREFEFNESTHSVTLEGNTDYDKVTVSYTGNSDTGAGDYVASATAEVKSDYANNYEISGTIPTCEWTINPKPIDISGVEFTAPDFTYAKDNGAAVSHTVALQNVPGHVLVSVKTDSDAATQTEAGDYTTVFVLTAEGSNYMLQGNTEITANWEIKAAKVAIPTALATNPMYDGSEKSGVKDNGDSSLYSVSGDTGINAKDYIAVYTLKDTKNYEWADSSFTGSIDWKIVPNNTKTVLADEEKPRYDDEEAKTLTAADIKTLLGDSNEDTTITVSGISVKAGGDGVVSVDTDAKTWKLVSNLQASARGKGDVVVISYTSNNYADGVVEITVTVQDKNDVKDQIVFDLSALNLTYNGQNQVDKAKTATLVVGSTLDAANISYDLTEAKDQGSYTITATYEDADNFGKKSQTFTIKQKAISISIDSVNDQEYDGDVAVDNLSGVTVSGAYEELTMGEDFVINNLKFTTPSAGEGKEVTYTVELKDTAKAKNYKLASSSGSTTGTITPKEISVTLDAIAPVTYTGANQNPTVSVSSDETVGGYSLVAGTDYQVVITNNVNAGSASVSVTSLSGSNYSFTVSGSFTINAAELTLSGATVSNKTYDTTAAAAVTAVTFGGLQNSEKLTIGVDFTVTAIFADANAGEDKTVTYTVTLLDTAKAKNYVLLDASAESTATINKARVTGKPAYTVIDASGKTLADAKLNIGTLQPAGGLLVWDSGDATKVEANKSYTWTYTPADATNYQVLTGSIVPYVYVEEEVDLGYHVNIFANGGGKVSSDNPQALPGAVVTLTVTPDMGKFLTKLEVLDLYGNQVALVSLGSNQYSFVMPLTGVIINSEFGSAPRAVFYDVSLNDWYYNAVYYAYDNGLMNGMGENEFAPTATTNRAMLVTILYRLEGSPAVYGANPFTDVANGQWYTDAIIWAEANGIVGGYGDGAFGPTDNITRQQLAKILYNYALYKGIAADSFAALGTYPDGSSVADWATTAMQWAVAEGLLQGMDGNLVPDGSAIRAQVATVLMRFIENVLK